MNFLDFNANSCVLNWQFFGMFTILIPIAKLHLYVFDVIVGIVIAAVVVASAAAVVVEFWLLPDIS